MVHFFQYVLRTTDVAAAAAFYATVLGRADAEIFQLHEEAVARGARPHWLGFLDVTDVAAVDATAAAFAARGAMPLGPKWVNGQGLEAAVMRDPGGAVVALGKPPATQGAASRPEVVWHLLNTVDVERTQATYAELFGWDFKSAVDIENHGVFHPFAWLPSGPPVGSLSDIAERPGVHPHWLFHFHVPALEPALDAVRAGGGLVIGPFTMPSGDRVAVCDDPQGAAFALLERRR
jgi:predicted enzyme related to lactoylglutathione lyase